jgi:hypothetical protein
LLAVAVLSVFLAACAGEGLVAGDRRNVGVVTVVFTASPAHARVGQPVRLAFRISNNGGKTEKLMSPSAKLYDFWVKRGSRAVWRWSDGHAFVQTFTNLDVETQSTKTFDEFWEPKEPGTYTAYGELTADGFTGPLKGTVVVR